MGKGCSARADIHPDARFASSSDTLGDEREEWRYIGSTEGIIALRNAYLGAAGSFAEYPGGICSELSHGELFRARAGNTRQGRLPWLMQRWLLSCARDGMSAGDERRYETKEDGERGTHDVRALSGSAFLRCRKLRKRVECAVPQSRRVARSQGRVQSELCEMPVRCSYSN
jgi:hypothetical protein